ncbi:MAG: chemotaxis protein CheA [Pirellulales bacterium]
MTDAAANVRDGFFDSLLGDFLDESGQLLDRLNENLLQLDEWVRALDDPVAAHCDEDLLNSMFRAAHSLKGLSAMLGLSDINQLTHKIENVFDAARKDELVIDGDTVELMFQAVDRLVGLVDGLKTPEAEKVECESVIAGIQNLLAAAGVERRQTTQADAERALQQELADPPPAPVEEPRPAQNQVQEAPVGDPGGESESDDFLALVDETEIPPKYLAIFIDETQLSLDSLTETLLALESKDDRQAIENLLIVSHRIKGSAASIGLNRPAKLAHFMEDLLQDLRENGGELTTGMTDAMLKCTDALRGYVEGLKQGNPGSESFSALANELLAAQAAAASNGSNRGDLQAASPATEAESRPSEAVSPRQPAGESVDELRARALAAAPVDISGYFGRVFFQADLPLVGLKARLAYEKLAHVGRVYYCHPAPEQLDELEDLPCLAFGIASDEPEEAVHRTLRISGVVRVEVEPLRREASENEAGSRERAAASRSSGVRAVDAAASAESSAANSASSAPRSDASAEKSGGTSGPSKARAGEASAKPGETLRVDIERLDQLMNLAGQLVINRARFARIGEGLRKLAIGKQAPGLLGNTFTLLNKISDAAHGGRAEGLPHAELETIAAQARRIQADLEIVKREIEQFTHVRNAVSDLAEATHQLDRVTDAIQKSVMDTRMVPVGPLFTRFKRVIRDITHANGKDIRLVIRGEKTELDKRMIDELGDPLIHMVRNSADHGIESPEAREAAGKSRYGTVTLDAFHRGNSIVIQVLDDGRGLDPDRIRAKAVEKGILSPADAEKLSNQQAFQLIWEPGFSTADKVTEISGRGMGMDIVRSKIEEINGTVELESTPGVGTTLTIKLPLTLAILPSLMAEIDGDVFALPVESVVEIVRVQPAEMRTVHGLATARVRGRVLSVVRLSELLAWNRSSHSAAQENEGATLVILSDRGREVGLAVQTLLGEEDIVIQSMAENYHNVYGIAGASILGDGRVSLILDVAALIEMASRTDSIKES